MSYFGHPLSIENEMVCCKERHPLLLECFTIFLRMYKNEWMSFWKHVQALSGPQCVISTNKSSQISCKMLDFGHTHNTANGIMCYKERQPLLLECFLTFPQYISIIRGTFDNIWKPLIVHIISFLPITNIKFHAKYQIVSTLSEHEMGWCVTRRDIHCCLSVS